MGYTKSRLRLVKLIIGISGYRFPISKFHFVLLHYFVSYAGVVNFKLTRNIYGDQHLLRHRYYVVNNGIKMRYKHRLTTPSVALCQLITTYL